jgi:hypothetical protein
MAIGLRGVGVVQEYLVGSWGVDQARALGLPPDVQAMGAHRQEAAPAISGAGARAREQAREQEAMGQRGGMGYR